MAHSHALHATLDGGGRYVVGPLARYTLNFDRLSPLARGGGAARPASGRRCRNPFRSHRRARRRAAVRLRRGAADHRRLRAAGRPAVAVRARAGVGHGATEAPRGILYHRYALAADGTILDARIVPPTSQNQARASRRTCGLRRRPALDLPTDELHLRVRAGHPQLRPVHLLRHPLPGPDGGARVTAGESAAPELVVGGRPARPGRRRGGPSGRGARDRSWSRQRCTVGAAGGARRA